MIAAFHLCEVVRPANWSNFKGTAAPREHAHACVSRAMGTYVQCSGT